MKSLAGTLALAPAEPSLLDPCTCLRDDQPCRVCDLWDRHIGWLEARPEHQAQRRVDTDV